MARRVRLAVLLVLLAALLTVVPIKDQGANAAQSLTFTAVGDISSSSAALSVLAAMRQEGPDLTLALGDLSYGKAGAEQQWCDMVTSRMGAGYPFELLSGNHESNGQNGNINDFAACLPNRLPGLVGTYGRQYYVDVPEDAPLIRYVMISPGLTYPDGEWDYSAGSPRYEWTAQAIDGARAAAIPWVVVGMHKPCVSLGTYSCDPGAAIFNLLLDKRVDLVLNGHEHIYSRTHALATGSPGCPAVVPDRYNAACVSPNQSMSQGAGVVSVTVGTGGVALRDVHEDDPELPYFAAYSGLNQNPTHGYLKVSATPGQLAGRFVGVDGTFTDEFTIAAGAPPVAATVTPATTTTTASTTTSTTAPPLLPAGNPLVMDDFAREVASGFGSAPLGGPWSTAADTSVNGSTGVIVLGKAVERRIRLDSTLSAGADLKTTFWADKPATGNGLRVTLIGRGVDGIGEFWGTAELRSDATVRASLTFVPSTGNDDTLAALTTVPGLTVAPGDKLTARLRVTGSSPTTLQFKVWKTGTAEPDTWVRTATATTADMQVPGSTGLRAYNSSVATNAPITLFVDEFVGTTA